MKFPIQRKQLIFICKYFTNIGPKLASKIPASEKSHSSFLPPKIVNSIFLVVASEEEIIEICGPCHNLPTDLLNKKKLFQKLFSSHFRRQYFQPPASDQLIISRYLCGKLITYRQSLGYCKLPLVSPELTELLFSFSIGL